MNNPYQMPAEAPTPTKPALPGVYKAIAIIFIVFGGFGILGNLCGVPAVILQGVATQGAAGTSAGIGSVEDLDEMTPDQFGAMLQVEMQPPLAITLIMLAVSFGVSSLMLTGGIMGLKGTPSSKRILIAGCVGGVLCQIISIGSGIFQMMAMSKVSEFMANSQLDAEMEAIASFTHGIAVGASAFGMIVGAIFAALYIAAMTFLLRSARVKNFLQAI